MKALSRAFWAIVAVMVAVAVAARAQTVTINGLRLDSPTLISLQTPKKDAPYVHFRGDFAMVNRVEDKEWDGPGVAVYCVVFNPRPFQAPPAPFVISGRRGTSILLSWLDLSGARAEGEWNVIDPRDFNRDKLVNVLDFHAFMASWAECGDARWYDGLEACDVRDPAAFLAAWRE